jgi:hypothetical protein
MPTNDIGFSNAISIPAAHAADAGTMVIFPTDSDCGLFFSASHVFTTNMRFAMFRLNRNILAISPSTFVLMDDCNNLALFLFLAANGEGRK